MTRTVQKIRTILIENAPMERAAFIDVISAHPELELIAAAASYAEGSKALEQPYDLLITDLDLGDGSGLDFIDRASCGGDHKVIVITVLGDVKSVLASVKAGADGYVLKSADRDELASAINTVLEGGAPISAAVAGHLLKRLRVADVSPASEEAQKAAGLTAREVETLTELAKGFSNKEVAKRLDISHHTVAEHVKAIYKKMSVNSRSQAVSQAYRDGLLS